RKMRKFSVSLAILAVILDAVAIVVAMFLAYKLRADGGDIYLLPPNTYLKMLWWVAPAWLVFLASQGLYNTRSLPTGWSAVGRLLIGLLSGWGAFMIFLYLSRSPEAQNFPRLLIIYGVGLTSLFCVIDKLLLSAFVGILRGQGIGVVRSVLLVSGNHQSLIKSFKVEESHGRRLVATIDHDYLVELSKLNSKLIDELVVPDNILDETSMLSIMNWADRTDTQFVLVPSLSTVRSTNVEMGTLAGSPVLFFRRTPLEGWGRVYKRLLDLIIVIPALIIFSPVYLLLIILVKVSSPGPVIYKEARVGQDGREFFVGKFRSMYCDWRERFPTIKDWSSDEKTDVRITPIGRIIRKTNIDELPQLLDVLLGKMSMVGPRPEQPKYVAQFAQELPDYLKRHHVKTGMTGWAQINGARGNTPIADRVKYDLYYIENWSIWFDIRIILATLIYLFRESVKR
ncbi:MAG: sugar transferase, partial [Patescibacteria group bacterium]